jgi:hypothetical protein
MMTDKRTGKKKKKIRPAATEETSGPIPLAPFPLPKKTNTPRKK